MCKDEQKWPRNAFSEEENLLLLYFWPYLPRARLGDKEWCNLIGWSFFQQRGAVPIYGNQSLSRLTEIHCETQAWIPGWFQEASMNRSDNWFGHLVFQSGVFQLLSSTLESGRLKCPFDPRQPFTSVLTGETIINVRDGYCLPLLHI